MKRIAMMTAGLFLVGQFTLAGNGLQWGSGINVITDFNDDPVATTEEFDPTAGAFAQLIRILTGSEPYDFINSGSGIDTDNEQVVATMYSGQHDDLADSGTFPFDPDAILANETFNGAYYVRVFDTPQATVGDWNLANDAPIPSAAQYFYQSGTYSYTYSELSPPSEFNFGSGQTLELVPEPGTMALLAAGLLGVFAVRRKRLG